MTAISSAAATVAQLFAADDCLGVKQFMAQEFKDKKLKTTEERLDWCLDVHNGLLESDKLLFRIMTEKGLSNILLEHPFMENHSKILKPFHKTKKQRIAGLLRRKKFNSALVWALYYETSIYGGWQEASEYQFQNIPQTSKNATAAATPALSLYAIDEARKSEIFGLMSEFAPLAHKLCHNMTGAKDLLQETALKLWANRRKLAEAVDTEAGFLFVLKKIFCSRAQYDLSSLLKDQRNIDAFVQNQRLIVLDLSRYEVTRRLNLMHPLEREALILIVAGGLNMREAGEICACSTATMRKHFSEAQGKLAVPTGMH